MQVLSTSSLTKWRNGLQRKTEVAHRPSITQSAMDLKHPTREGGKEQQCSIVPSVDPVTYRHGASKGKDYAP